MANNDQIQFTKDKFEKITHGVEDRVKQVLASNEDVAELLSGVTLNPITEGSSLMMDEPQERKISAPNFISDCFFLCHIMIGYVNKTLETFYKKNNENLNKSVGAKDYGTFDQHMAQKISMDAHVFGKHIIVLYRNLFSFTNCLIILQQERVSVTPKMFNDLHTFLDQGVNPLSENDFELPLDYQVMP